jgi:small GTP-binding protein
MISGSSSYRARVVMLGESAVGKTSILTRLTDHRFDFNQASTIGANYQIYAAEIDGLQVEMQIWDTAGQERFRSLGPIYYRNAVGAIAVFDVTSRPSFEHLSSWIDGFTTIAGNNVTIAIVGNKIDLEDSRKVNWTETKEFAEARGYLAYETSAFSGKGIPELFANLTKNIVDVRQVSVPRPTQIVEAETQTYCTC